MRKAKYLGMSWQVVVLVSAAAVGFIGMAFFPEGLVNPEMVFVEITKTLFSPFFAALVICGVFAANMSTMDAQILVCATVMSEDFYKRIFNKKASPREVLFVSRISVILFGVIAFYMAYGQNATIMSIVEYAWSGLGSAFGPVLLTVLYSKSVNRYGAIGGILTGGTVALFWPMINPWLTHLEISSMIPGFSASLIAIYVTSWVTRRGDVEAPYSSIGVGL